MAPRHATRLRPFQPAIDKFIDELRAVAATYPSDELQQLERSANGLSSTNCGWSLKWAQNFIVDAIEQVQIIRRNTPSPSPLETPTS